MVKMHPSNHLRRGNISVQIRKSEHNILKTSLATHPQIYSCLQGSHMVSNINKMATEIETQPMSLCGLTIGDRFKIIGNEPLGSGSGGEVWEAIDIQTNELIALKRINKNRGKEKERERAISKDQQLQSNPLFVCPKLAIIDTRFETGTLFVSTSLRKEGDLRMFLYNKGPLRFKQARSALADLLISIEFLHSNKNIIHRDIKPENLYWDGINLRLGDFGLARNFPNEIKQDNQLTPQMVTLWYRAPEIILGSKLYNKSVDIFSIGCVFGELLLGKPLFKGRSEIDQIKLEFELLGFPTLEDGWPSDISNNLENLGIRGGNSASGSNNDIISKERWARLTDKMPFGTSSTALDLMFKLMAINPKDRPSARDALFHPFFWEEPKVAEWRSHISNGNIFSSSSTQNLSISPTSLSSPTPSPTESLTSPILSGSMEVPSAPLKYNNQLSLLSKSVIPIEKSSTLCKKSRKLNKFKQKGISRCGKPLNLHL